MSNEFVEILPPSPPATPAKNEKKREKKVKKDNRVQCFVSHSEVNRIDRHLVQRHSDILDERQRRFCLALYRCRNAKTQRKVIYDCAKCFTICLYSHPQARQQVWLFHCRQGAQPGEQKFVASRNQSGSEVKLFAKLERLGCCWALRPISDRYFQVQWWESQVEPWQGALWNWWRRCSIWRALWDARASCQGVSWDEDCEEPEAADYAELSVDFQAFRGSLLPQQVDCEMWRWIWPDESCHSSRTQSLQSSSSSECASSFRENVSSCTQQWTSQAKVPTSAGNFGYKYATKYTIVQEATGPQLFPPTSSDQYKVGKVVFFIVSTRSHIPLFFSCFYSKTHAVVFYYFYSKSHPVGCLLFLLEITSRCFFFSLFLLEITCRCFFLFLLEITSR